MSPAWEDPAETQRWEADKHTKITGTIDLEWMADFLWKYYGAPYRDMRLAKEWADEMFGGADG